MGAGRLVLSTQRLFLIDQSGKCDLKILELPLDLTYETRFEKPTMGKNHWHGMCRHRDDLIKDDIEFKIYFKGGQTKF